MINQYLVNRGDLRPAHMHDCEKCEFQGMHEDRGELFDVYLCARADADFGPMKTTLVARYSSDDPEYLSFPLLIAEQIASDGNPRWKAFVEVVRDRHVWVTQSALARQEAMNRNFVVSLARPD